MADFQRSRRVWLGRLLAAGMLIGTMPYAARAHPTRQLTDIANRQVTIDRPIHRVLLGDGTLAYAFALLIPDTPFNSVVGWGENFKAADLDGYHAYLQRFPHMGSIPSFPATTIDSIGSELAISLAPDVVILNLSSRAAAESSGLMARLAQVNIPVIFVDFRTQMFANTVRSIEILGDLVEQQDRAAEFLQFRTEQINRVTEALQHVQTRPSVMIERAAGLYNDCCMTYGHGNFGELVAIAGGDNLGSHFVHGTFGTLHPEQVISAEPDIILITGANWSMYSQVGDWVNLGPGADPEKGQARLQKLMRRPAYRSLSAVQAKKVYAIWHPFYDNPYYFIALQRIAKWLHPELFASLDPEQTFIELHQRFLPVPYQPGYWLSLDETTV